uniref:Uncharacterized protein n=1 Tax=Compsopogon caeruleus TaxID=31354 RepID=A0A7S1TI43_9RHOD|mmetsp:Transcript_8609/g.17451  ORF Transcript_8609/g.17451 Transcript_8609/m.17451 type:complete len:236 (+) Transcript_8609:246-953(+)
MESDFRGRGNLHVQDGMESKNRGLARMTKRDYSTPDHASAIVGKRRAALGDITNRSGGQGVQVSQSGKEAGGGRYPAAKKSSVTNGKDGAGISKSVRVKKGLPRSVTWKEPWDEHSVEDIEYLPALPRKKYQDWIGPPVIDLDETRLGEAQHDEEVYDLSTSRWTPYNLLKSPTRSKQCGEMELLPNCKLPIPVSDIFDSSPFPITRDLVEEVESSFFPVDEEFMFDDPYPAKLR